MALESQAKAVVFDLDGLMVNTEQLYDLVGEELLGRRGKHFTPQLKDAMMGRPGRQALQIMIRWHQLTDEIAQLQSESDEILTGLLKQQLAPMPGLVELLNALVSAGIPRAIATSSRRVFVDQTLARLNLNADFAFVLGAEDVRCGKPDPEIYLTAARLFSLPPENMLVLEDSQTGSQAAVRAGALTVAVPGDHSRHHSFRGVHFVATGLADRRIYGLLGLPG